MESQLEHALWNCTLADGLDDDKIDLLNIPHHTLSLLSTKQAGETSKTLSEHLRFYGKGTFGNLPQRLSISHTQDIGVLLALPDDIEPQIMHVGVDIELTSRKPPSPAVIRRIFSSQEQAWIAGGAVAPLEAWCIKEALWKAWPANHEGPLPYVQMTGLSLRPLGRGQQEPTFRLESRVIVGERYPLNVKQGKASLGKTAPYQAEWGVQTLMLHGVEVILAWAVSLDHSLDERMP